MVGDHITFLCYVKLNRHSPESEVASPVTRWKVETSISGGATTQINHVPTCRDMIYLSRSHTEIDGFRDFHHCSSDRARSPTTYCQWHWHVQMNFNKSFRILGGMIYWNSSATVVTDNTSKGPRDWRMWVLTLIKLGNLKQVGDLF